MRHHPEAPFGAICYVRGFVAIDADDRFLALGLKYISSDRLTTLAYPTLNPK